MDLLRSNLQPLTHSLPAPIRDIGLSLLGPACYKTLILDINPSDTPCLTLALSKTLGLATVAGSSIVKLPQILKLLSSQSATGISFLSYFLETTSFITTLAYSARNGFPFTTYGETAMIAAQNVGGTGQLSAFAVFNYLIGSMTRIFTTLKEVDDSLILYGYVAGFILNSILVAQMVYYWNSPATASHAGEMGEKPEKIAMGSTTGATPKSKGPTTRRRG
ncbi:hypothetical protein JMJ35_001326 [Cladonia borealis]|uniref:Solute carrier family 66 member 3 n=1 Tax=Cladonia borealis TaxID=184061 RepID=A0AA39R8C7_9LECA|nr:hypothetical protein JMJ35_001326 [Cladonia borealis]